MDPLSTGKLGSANVEIRISFSKEIVETLNSFRRESFITVVYK